MKKSSWRQFVAIFLILLLGIWSACEKNPTKNESPAKPTLPPSSSMDLSELMQFQTGLQKSNVFTKNNYTNAVIRLAIINTVVALNLAVPTAVFAKAASQEAVLKSDGKFHWIYTDRIGLHTYEADLAGWIDVANQQVVWEMYITCKTIQPALDKFKWYVGRAELTEPKGYWLFYDNLHPQNVNEVLRIDWTIAAENDRTLLLTGLAQGSEIEGDSLTYRWLGDDRTVTLVDAQTGNTVIIYWDDVTGAGYLQAPDYNNGEKSYWDENHDDIGG